MTTTAALAHRFADLQAKCSLMAGCPVELTHMGGTSFSILADGDRRPELEGLRGWLASACPGPITAAQYDAEADCSVIYLVTSL